MKSIESLDEWAALAVRLSANGYTLWQMQYDTRSSESFNVWFSKPGKHNYEVATYNEEEEEAIFKWRQPK